VRLRGNVKEMERELKVPYSTVRGRLDEVIGELGFESEPGRPEHAGDGEIDLDGDEGARREILLRLEQGSIDADAAVQELESLKSGKDGRES
jgi:hypothetical protein